MVFLLEYILFSLLFSLFLCIYDYRIIKSSGDLNPLKNRDQNPIFSEAVEAGDIQKELYGDRIVYNPVTDEGRKVMASVEAIEEIYKKNEPHYWLIRYLIVAVTWPWVAYDLIRKY